MRTRGDGRRVGGFTELSSWANAQAPDRSWEPTGRDVAHLLLRLPGSEGTSGGKADLRGRSVIFDSLPYKSGTDAAASVRYREFGLGSGPTTAQETDLLRRAALGTCKF
jgi:hypothetical protein